MKPYKHSTDLSLLALAAALLCACGSSSGGPQGGGAAKCVTGATVSCACANGTSGAQTCASDGTFGACQCGQLNSVDDGDSGPSDTGATQEPDGGAVSSASSALQVVSLTSTAGTLTGGSAAATEVATTTFIAIVTDTAGLDAIAGGSLIDSAGATYAAFGAGANKGTYTATVTWASINQASPIDLPANGQRAFTAKFFDNVGQVATATLPIVFQCRDPYLGLMGACDGACADTTQDGANCGACGHACSAGSACEASACKSAASATPACLITEAFAPNETCATFCSAAGLGCNDMLSFSDPTCGTMIVGDDCTLSLDEATFAQKSYIECVCR